MARADDAGLDEVAQTLQVWRLKVRISTIGPRRFRVIPNRIHFGTPKWNHLEKLIEQTTFHFHDLKKRNLGELRPNKLEDGNRIRYVVRKLRYVVRKLLYFLVAIDRARVSPGIIRSRRVGWRTINCSVFVTDERSALSLCPTEDRTNMVVIRIRCASVLCTHPHVSSEFCTFRCLVGEVCQTYGPLSHTAVRKHLEHLSSNDFPSPGL